MGINLFLRSTFFPIIDSFFFFFFSETLFVVNCYNYRYFLNEASIVRLFANISNHYHEISLCLLLVCTLAVTNYFIMWLSKKL